MEHPKAIGDRTAVAVMLALMSAGFDIYLPFGENTRCDLIAAGEDALHRIQCKTGRIRDGAIKFKVCSSYAHHANPTTRFRSYEGEVDAFGVYCEETRGVYLVPMADLTPNREAALRVTAPLNNQRRRVRFASDYEIGRILIEEPGATGGLAARAGAGAPSA